MAAAVAILETSKVLFHLVLISLLHFFLVRYAVMARREVIIRLGNVAQLKYSNESLRNMHVVVWKKGEITLRHDIDSETMHHKDNFISKITEDKLTVFLRISNVRFKDAGNYSCWIYPAEGVAQKQDWSVQVQGIPRVNLSESIFVEKDIAIAKCCVDFALQTAKVEYQWTIKKRLESSVFTHDTKTLLGNKHETCSNFSFQILREYDQALLKCMIKNQLNLSDSAIINITYSARVRILQGYSAANTRTGMRGANTTVTCIADANPEPSISLEKKNEDEIWEELNLTASIRSENENTYWWTFSFDNSGNDIVGTYRCAAFNGISSPSVSKEIHIEMAVFADSDTIHLQRFLYPMLGLIVIIFVGCVVSLVRRVLTQESQTLSTSRSQKNGSPSHSAPQPATSPVADENEGPDFGGILEQSTFDHSPTYEHIPIKESPSREDDISVSVNQQDGNATHGERKPQSSSSRVNLGVDVPELEENQSKSENLPAEVINLRTQKGSKESVHARTFALASDDEHTSSSAMSGHKQKPLRTARKMGKISYSWVEKQGADKAEDSNKSISKTRRKRNYTIVVKS